MTHPARPYVALPVLFGLSSPPLAAFPHADSSNRPNALRRGIGSGAERRRRRRRHRHPELGGSCSPGKRFRCHPVGTAVLVLLLLVLALALGAAVAVLAAPQVPVTPATPPSVLGCPFDWVGYKGFYYNLSRDYSTWEQAQERCSKLNASLAIVKDEEALELLFRLCGNGDFWLGLRRRGERLQWLDNSSYSFPDYVHGDSECVYLADKRLKTGNCSEKRPYVCSKPEGPL
ncbi:C-type lectin domain family 2 member H-like [Melospiza melodia melodia]